MPLDTLRLPRPPYEAPAILDEAAIRDAAWLDIQPHQTRHPNRQWHGRGIIYECDAGFAREGGAS